MPDSDTNREYLGDSVYVDIENGMLKLTTENGMGPSNTIYLEPGTYLALESYWNRKTAQAKAGREQQEADC